MILYWSHSAIRSTTIMMPLLLNAALAVLAVSARLILYPRLYADERLWDDLAQLAARVLAGSGEEYSSGPHHGKDGYPWILGSVYAAFGTNHEYALAMNVLLGMASVLLVARSTELIGIHSDLAEAQVSRATRVAAYAAAVSPLMVYADVWVLREALTTCLVCAIALSLTKAATTANWVGLWPGVLATIIVYWLRSRLGLGLMVGLAGSWAVVRIRRGRHSGAAASLMVLPLAALVVLARRLGESVLNADEEGLAYSVQAMSDLANSGFVDVSLEHARLGELLSITLPRVLGGPFPWEWRMAPSMILATIEGGIWIVTLLLAARSTFRGPRIGHGTGRGASAVWGLWTLGGTLLLTFAVSIGSYGTLARMRPLAWCCLLPVAAFAMTQRAREERPDRPAAAAGPAWRRRQTMQLRKDHER
jgi:hypothetical protein